MRWRNTLWHKRGFANFPATPGSVTFKTEHREHIMRAGLNYRIGGNAAYMPAPTYNWAGFYLGANAGSAIARNQVDSFFTGGGTIFAHFTEMPKGYIGGVQGGYNWQSSNWVLGVEADIQGSNQKDDDNCHGRCATNVVNLAYQQRMNWLGTLRGRVGYALGPTLFYGTAGAAWSTVNTDVQVAQVPGLFISAASLSHRRSGWTVGGGMETPLDFFGLLGKNWTATTEYLYVDLGRTTVSIDGAPFGTHTMDLRFTEHVFRGGINYHFNTPVVAKY